MKKLLLSVLGVLTCFALTTPVFAAESIGADKIKTDDCSNCNVTVGSVTVGGDVSEDIFNKINAVNNGSVALEELGVNASDVEGYELATTIKDINVTGFTDSVTLTFEVNGVNTGDTVKVLHFVNGDWKIQNATVVAANTVEATFTSFSPIGIIVKKASVSTSTSTDAKEVGGWDDGGPFTTDECGNVFDRWGNEVYHATSCVVNNGSNSGYNFVNTADR